MEKSESVENLVQFVVDSVRQAHADDAPFQRTECGFRSTAGTRVKRPIRRKLCKREHVSRADSDSRYSGLPHFQAHRQPLERNHRPVLSAAGQFHAAYRDDLSRGAPKWTKTEEGADAVFAKYRLRVCGGR